MNAAESGVPLHNIFPQKWLIVLAESSESLVLGGERKEMTFLFSDIRGFTKISEQYKDDPEALTQLINQLLTVLSNSILEHGGTIDKYMGDCIMAFWNAPTDQADHRQLAIKAAHSMNEALDEFNAQTEGNLDFKLEIGIGINSGNCIVGNMGSDKRFDYTVLGDAVNLASRLESQSSNYGLHMIWVRILTWMILNSQSLRLTKLQSKANLLLKQSIPVLNQR